MKTYNITFTFKGVSQLAMVQEMQITEKLLRFNVLPYDYDLQKKFDWQVVEYSQTNLNYPYHFAYAPDSEEAREYVFAIASSVKEYNVKQQ